MSDTWRIIGDCHGKYSQYKKIIAGAERSICVGDMGVGFRYRNQFDELLWSQNPPHDAMVKHGARYIPGNHDNRSVYSKDVKCIPDGTVWDDVMFIGGAVSIDRGHRIEGMSWWADEECSMQQLYEFYDKYMEVKPRVMICHECPEIIADTMMRRFNQSKMDYPSRTRQAFQSMWESHKPEAWYFGHWHVDWTRNILGTQFTCLNELSYVDIEL